MRSIYKYAATPRPDDLDYFSGNGFEIEMPMGAQILDAQIQNGTPNIWALVDTLSPPVSRRFRFYGTGWSLPDAFGHYVATFQQPPFVWHLFEVSNA